MKLNRESEQTLGFLIPAFILRNRSHIQSQHWPKTKWVLWYSESSLLKIFDENKRTNYNSKIGITVYDVLYEYTILVGIYYTGCPR